MAQEEPERAVDRFIQEEIGSVPHLEALLLLWRNQSHDWSVQDMAHSLYVSPEQAEKILQDLARRDLIASKTEAPRMYRYDSGSEPRNNLLRKLDETYRHELIRISRMIHSKAAPAIRDFARAFRFTKDKD